MKILLITTGNNHVLKKLSRMAFIELHILEITSERIFSKSIFINRLRTMVNSVLPQMIVTWRCPYIIPASIFTIPVLGTYNLHPSLLPAYPGLNPWKEMLHAKETEGGVTLHRITSDVDCGEILMQESFIIGNNLDKARHKADLIAAEIIYRFICSHIGTDL